MSDKLGGLLSRLGGEGATLLRGRITAVSTGALTVLINGDEVGRVGYLKGAWIPDVGEEIFLLNQAGFGMLALGSPVLPAAPGALPEQLTLGADPVVLAEWRVTPAAPDGVWVATGTGQLTQLRNFQSSGAWFYDAADFASWADTALSRVEMEVTVLSGVPELVLHRTASTAEALETYGSSVTLSLTPGIASWVSLPLAWGRDLLSGEAKGVAVSSQQFDAVLDLSGSLRFTSL